MRKSDFKKIESLLEDILNDKSKVIDLIAENGNKEKLPEELFLDVEVQNSVFLINKASLFVGLYVELIKEITNVDFDIFKKTTEEDIILHEEVTEDIIIDIGKYIQKNIDKKDTYILKKYKSHTITFFELKNILKWFEVCKNNNLRIHII
jgi:hypothetical protein